MDKKILIVDDDPGICNSLALLLHEEGYCVEKTTDSAEAAALIKKNTYDLYLFDYKMKGLNGVDLLNMTKKINPHSRVFIISGMLNIDKLKKNARLADDIISKPFDVEELLQRIAAAV